MKEICNKIYLATPYIHSDPLISKARFEAVNKLAAKLFREGHMVFSPISHTHPIAIAGNLPKGWKFWAEYDYTFIEWCDEVHVFQQDGWRESIGVKNEIKLAKKMNKPIIYIESIKT